MLIFRRYLCKVSTIARQASGHITMNISEDPDIRSFNYMSWFWWKLLKVKTILVWHQLQGTGAARSKNKSLQFGDFWLGLKVIIRPGWDSTGDMVMLLLMIMIMLDKMILVVLILVVWFPNPRFWKLVMALVMVMMMSRKWQSFVPSGLEFLPVGLNIVVLQTFYRIQSCSLKLKVTIHKVHHLGLTTSIKIEKNVFWIDDGDDFDKQDGWSYCSVFKRRCQIWCTIELHRDPISKVLSEW